MNVAATPRTSSTAPWRGGLRRLFARISGLWLSLRYSIAMGLFGASGATTIASVQHVVHTCGGGQCTACGRCAVALVAAAAAASGGVAGCTRGARRRILIALVVAAGLLLYGVLEVWKRGWFAFPG